MIISEPLSLKPLDAREKRPAMPIEIQILQRGDEAMLENVAPGVFDDPIVTRAAKEYLSDPRHHLAVAIEDTFVIGFASGVHYIHPDKPYPEFWINEVGITPTNQGQGVGKALMRALLEVARAVGCAEVWVLTERVNLPAMGLYKSIGGEEAPDETVMFTFRLTSP
jgi:aminoglycoside 6'-N-acetyltransferase I